MFIIFISILGAFGFGWLYSLLENATYGIYVVGFLGFWITALISNKLIQRPFMAIINQVQAILQESQALIQRKINQFQNKPGSSQFAMQKSLEKIQQKAAKEAIELLKTTQPLFKWNFLLKKNADTMSSQLYFQLKDFDNAETSMQNAILVDALTIAMKMSLMYKKNKLPNEPTAKDIKNWPVTKAFKKGIWKVKKEQNGFLYSVYGWMLVQNNLIDEAITVLIKGKDKSIDDIVPQNLEFLQNNQPKKYAMAKYADSWWSLFLQEPPKQKAKQVKQKAGRGGHRPF